ncbi:MAG: nickel-dependent lactate racemase [Anaerolineae bacterium]|jgi:nickel-dependent lactate racemase
MLAFALPYGRGQLTFLLPRGLCVKVLEPESVGAAANPTASVEAALDAPIGGVNWQSWRGLRSAAIAINDKTRPVPHEHLLPPLLRRLEGLGLEPEAVRLLIASGAHPPMSRNEFADIIPAEVRAGYPVQCHDANNRSNLVHLGETSRGTPVWINRHFLSADLRLVVGNIEPHQFQGFSGGVKGAAIGLAGRETIERNHSLMTHPQARLGAFEDNPARQDVEEIGQTIGVHLALNAVLTGQKQIAHVLAGEPRAVMEAGIPLSRSVCQVAVAAPFDLVIASPGGHPKDINLYQSQKALAHASLVTRDGGTVILVAACPEGPGSQVYTDWMMGMRSYNEVLAKFGREGFRIGPHKAYQIARDAARVRTLLVSEMAPALVRRLLLTPTASLDVALELALPDLPAQARVGIMPRASSTIPLMVHGEGGGSC